MSAVRFRVYVAQFLVSLGAFLGALYVAHFLFNLPPKPVIVSHGPFKICDEYKVVKPGEPVCYIVHYTKRLDIPGDITKQLIIKTKTGLETYIPLNDTAGHLPVGEVTKKAYAKIPDWAPEGIAKLKLSSTYNLGGKPPDPDVAYTQEFEIRK